MLCLRLQAQEVDYLHAHLVFEACCCTTLESLCLVYNLVYNLISLCLASLPAGKIGRWGIGRINSKASTGSLSPGCYGQCGRQAQNFEWHLYFSRHDP